MKSFWNLFVCSFLLFGRSEAQTMTDLKNQRTHLLKQSTLQLQQLYAATADLQKAKEAAEQDIYRRARKIIESANADAEEAESKLKEQKANGTWQDASLVVGSGDVTTGVGLALFNGAIRRLSRSGVKESNDAILQGYKAQAYQFQQQKLTELEGEYAVQMNAHTRPMIDRLNRFFATRPPVPQLPAPTAPARQTSVYVYYGIHCFDRILFSDVWRIDRAPDKSWVSASLGEQHFTIASANFRKTIENQGYTSPVEKGIYSALINRSSDYAFSKTFTMGAFATPEAALQHQIKLMEQARGLEIPVAAVEMMPQLSQESLQEFGTNGGAFWGVKRGTLNPNQAETERQRQQEADKKARQEAEDARDLTLNKQLIAEANAKREAAERELSELKARREVAERQLAEEKTKAQATEQQRIAEAKTTAQQKIAEEKAKVLAAEQQKIADEKAKYTVK